MTAKFGLKNSPHDMKNNQFLTFNINHNLSLEES